MLKQPDVRTGVKSYKMLNLNKLHKDLYKLPCKIVSDPGKWFICYCPALQLSGYGRSKGRAKKSLHWTIGACWHHWMEHNQITEYMECVGFNLSPYEAT